MLTLLAHAGHDHAFTLGGELHHWLWLAGGVAVAVAGRTALRGVCRAVRRQPQRAGHR